MILDSVPGARVTHMTLKQMARLRLEAQLSCYFQQMDEGKLSPQDIENVTAQSMDVIDELQRAYMRVVRR